MLHRQLRAPGRGWWWLGSRRQWCPKHFETLTSAATALGAIRKPVSTLVLLYVSAVDHISSVVWLNQRWVCFGCGVFVGCSLALCFITIKSTTQNHLLILWVKHTEIRAWESCIQRVCFPKVPLQWGREVVTPWIVEELKALMWNLESVNKTSAVK